MGIDHRGAATLVPEEFLDIPDACLCANAGLRNGDILLCRDHRGYQKAGVSTKPRLEGMSTEVGDIATLRLG